jgi:predicted GIY-YIG superfamily endonuclease
MVVFLDKKVKIIWSIASHRVSNIEGYILSERTIEWDGISGKTYTYWIYETGYIFANQPGNYVFARETESGRFKPIYIGQTDDLSERFDNHHKMSCIRRNGATHICAHKSSENESTRRAEELDLIKRWKPTCND